MCTLRDPRLTRRRAFGGGAILAAPSREDGLLSGKRPGGCTSCARAGYAPAAPAHDVGRGCAPGATWHSLHGDLRPTAHGSGGDPWSAQPNHCRPVRQSPKCRIMVVRVRRLVLLRQRPGAWRRSRQRWFPARPLSAMPPFQKPVFVALLKHGASHEERDPGRSQRQGFVHLRREQHRANRRTQGQGRDESRCSPESAITHC